MNPVDAVISVLKNYFNFDGRARRSEYWWFQVFFCVVYFPVYLIIDRTESFVLAIVFVLFALAMVIPSIAVEVRRLHDVGKSGWWYFISFVPFGGFVLFYFNVLDSEPGENEYGPCPKEMDEYQW